MEVASGPKPPQTAPRLFRGSSEVGAFEGRGAEAWRAGRHKGSSRNCSGEPPTARLGCRMYSSGDTSVILFFWDQDLAVFDKFSLICAYSACHMLVMLQYGFIFKKYLFGLKRK